MKMADQLKKEFQYYLENKEELVKQYKGKFIVIVGDEVVGSYDSELQAIQEASQKHKLGTFLVQRCEMGEESYRQIFHSRIGTY